MSIYTIEKTASPGGLQKLEKALSVMKYLPNEQQLSALIRVLEAVDTKAKIDLSARPETRNSSRQQIADMIKKVFYEDRSLEYTYISDGSPQAVITILRDLTTRTWHASFLLSEGNNIDFRGPFLLGNDIGEVGIYSEKGWVIQTREGEDFIPVQNQKDGCYLAFEPSLESPFIKHI